MEAIGWWGGVGWEGIQGDNWGDWAGCPLLPKPLSLGGRAQAGRQQAWGGESPTLTPAFHPPSSSIPGEQTKGRDPGVGGGARCPLCKPPLQRLFCKEDGARTPPLPVTHGATTVVPHAPSLGPSVKSLCDLGLFGPQAWTAEKAYLGVGMGCPSLPSLPGKSCRPGFEASGHWSQTLLLVLCSNVSLASWGEGHLLGLQN